MAKNTKHKHIKQQKKAAAGERIIHITHVLNKYSGIRACQHLSWDCVFELVMFRRSIIFASDWFGPQFLFCQNQFYDRGYLSNVWIHRYLVYLANWGRDFLTE